MTTVSARMFTPAVLVAGLFVVGCADSSPTSPASLMTAPSATRASALTVSAGGHARPIQGSCQTVITPLDPASVGACTVFEQAPSVFIAISGQCQLAHLGRTSLAAQQQVLFQLDTAGQPIIVKGQPVFSGLRNCAVLTAADGDQLRHTTSGSVAPGAEPGTVSFEGALTFTGGSGRFSSASGAASFSGGASLVTNTGAFTLGGTIDY